MFIKTGEYYQEMEGEKNEKKKNRIASKVKYLRGKKKNEKIEKFDLLVFIYNLSRFLCQRNSRLFVLD